MLLVKKKVLVVGLGISGRSAVQFLLKQGADVFCFDKDKNLKNHDEIKLFILDGSLKFIESLDDLKAEDFDLIVVSPGISLDETLREEAKKAHVEIIGEMELGARYLKNRAIGITGTNGKTTVTLLIEHVLNASSIKAKAVGNIGLPLTSYLLNDNDPDEILVIELSSYQLETMSAKVFDAGIILNITPDHLDRYLGMDEYAKAKFKLQDCVKDKSFFYVDEVSQDVFKHYFKGENNNCFGFNSSESLLRDIKNVYLKEKFPYTLPYELDAKKSHDILNLIAAFKMVETFNLGLIPFLKAFASFKKPAHRVEFVRETNFVKYYDDSKGTNIDAVMKAVDSLKEPIYLIAGGVDKGSGYAPWKFAFKNKVKGIFVIGQAACKIKAELESEIEVEMCESLEVAVKNASKKASSGDVVLLSPGCSSFDMFKDYKERGNEFKRVVNLL